MEKQRFTAVFILLPLIVCCHATSDVISCIASTCEPLPPNCYYLSDANGCPTCNVECNDPSCPAIDCSPPCYNGHVKDANGCNTCTCKTECLRRNCANKECPFGFRLDKTGCPTCACNPRPLPCHRFLNCPRTGVCPNACDCKPNCYPRGSDDLFRRSNFLQDFLDLIFRHINTV